MPEISVVVERIGARSASGGQAGLDCSPMNEVICSIDSLSYAWLLDLARKVIELNCPFTNRHLVHGAKKAILRDISAE